MSELATIIINWNNASLTAACAKAVQKWSISNRILIVDNKSNPEDIAALKAATHDIEILFLEQNLGFGAANNAAINYLVQQNYTAKVLLLNNDASIANSEITKLLEHYDKMDKIGALGPIVEENRQNSTVYLHGGRNIVENVNTRADRAKPNFTNKLVTCDYVPGMIFLTDVSNLKAVGVFDEDYFFSGEIADWCYRAAVLGFQSYLDQSAIGKHDKSSNSSNSNLYNYYSLRNRFLFNSKHKLGKGLNWFLKSSNWALSRLLRFDFSGFRTILLAQSHGISGKFGNQNEKFQ